MTRRWRPWWVALLFGVLLAGAWFALRSPASTESPRVERNPTVVVARPTVTRDADRTLEPVHLSAASVVAHASPAGSFSGRVISLGTGQGIPHAELTFELQGVAATVRADASGAFTFLAPTPGIYRLAAVTAEEFVPYAPEWGHSPITLTAEPGRQIEGLSIYLQPALLYAGLVVDSKSQPVVGAQIQIIDPGDARMSLMPLTEKFVSDARGEFFFRAANDAVLEARHEGFGPGRARLNFNARAARRLTLTLGDDDGPTSAGTTISGRVLDATGIPAEGARVTANIEERGRGLHPAGQATADGNGHFVLSGLDPGTYSVEASQLGAVPARREEVPGGADNVELRLSAGGRLRGTVRDGDTGQPVQSFTLAVAEKKGPLREDAVLSQTFMDPGGRFELGGIPSGEMAVTAAALGYGVSKSVAVHVEAGSAASVEVVMRKGGRVAGLVREEGSGVPIARARVSTENRLGAASSAIPALAFAVTDEGGHFQLEGLAEGLQSITAEADGHHGRIVSGLRVQSDGNIGPITFELTPTQPGEQPSLDLVGIGAVMQARDEVLVIMRVISGGGADLAQLMAGDQVLTVDGVPVAALGFQGSIERIRGPEGSSVSLTVQKSAGPVVAVTVSRSRVRG